MDVQLKRGMLDACVLTVLRRGDSYGYQLVRDVGEIIAVSESTLYPILKRLEAGERRIHAFLDEWRELLRALSRIEAEVEGR